MPCNPDKIDYSAQFPKGFDSFTIIEDPRTGNHKKHHFGEVIFMSVTAMLCGMNTFSDIAEFVDIQLDWFKKWIKMPNGIPTSQTFSNIFQIIDPKNFTQCLTHHVKTLFPELALQIIAIDGKTLRGSHGLKSESEHCVSAWAQESGVTLALEYVQQKSNEITAIPKLLEQLELNGHVVTLDAMGTQTKIAQDIINKGADYILALKGNQGKLHQEALDQFHFAVTQIKMEKSEKWDLHSMVEKSNGRITTRRIAVTNDVEWMDSEIRGRWAGLKSLIMVESSVTALDTHKITKQKRFYISSLDSSAEEFQAMIRSHWSIENQCHWVLDTLFREDHNQTNAKRAAQNLGILRRIVLNILKQDKVLVKKSLPKKRMHAFGNSKYLEQLLSLA